MSEQHNSASSTDRDTRALTVGVITNMYPLPGSESFGVFVRQRVDTYRNAGVTVDVTGPSVRSGAMKYPRLLAAALWSLVSTPRPDVYEVHYIAPTGIIGMVIARIARRPYVLYAHGSDVEVTPSSTAYRRLIAIAVRHAAEVHTNSDYMVNEIKERWHPPNPVIAIPPGTHIPAAPAGLDGRDIDVLFVGNLNDGKGVDVLIDATLHIDIGRPVRAVIAGDGPSAPALKQHALEKGLEISFPGAVPPDDVPALMARAGVLAVPSRREGLGQVAIEALAQGTPVVVSNVGGLASVPTHGCGTLVPPEDARALANAISLWLNAGVDDRRVAAATAHQRSKDFDVTRLGARALERLRSVANTARRQVGSSRKGG